MIYIKGVHRSKGFGFVEFTSTALAKKALHAVNNSSTVFKNGPKPIVQFSIEDMRALKKKQERYERIQNDKSKRSFSTTHKKPNRKPGLDKKKMNPKELKKIENKRFNKAPDQREFPSKNRGDKKFVGEVEKRVKQGEARNKQKFKKKSELKKKSKAATD